jgi:hypothetical protein
MRPKFLSLPNTTLFVALALSAVAAYYSIIGLTAIFAGAVIPIVVMGIILEIAKITTTVWLRTYWKQCGWLMKSYLVPSVVTLALITSMGIFGFLSKSHLDQGIGTGDVSAKVALIDEKVKTQRENIKSSREALAQMDMQVNNVMIKGDTETSAARSVQIRRQQASERGKLQKEIELANTTIGKLNEERAPIASQLRKVEAEVGPIKYIAAMIYGDNPDQNILEKAVRWVIILLVLVFDPLAIALILAANQSRYWKVVSPEDEEIGPKPDDPVKEQIPPPGTPWPGYPDLEGTINNESLTEEQVEQIDKVVELLKEKSLAELHPYLKDFPDRTVESTAPHQVYHRPEQEPEVDGPIERTVYEPELELPTIESELEALPDLLETTADNTATIQTDGVTKESEYRDLDNGYVLYHNKQMTMNVFRDMRPDLFLQVDGARKSATNFGTHFPEVARPGDVFVRVDVLPNKVYKYNGDKWIMVNKDQTTTYLYDQEYIKYLVTKIDQGEYDVNLLSSNEKQQIEEYLTNQNT